jgi:hypothetical protein
MGADLAVCSALFKGRVEESVVRSDVSDRERMPEDLSAIIAAHVVSNRSSLS